MDGRAILVKVTHSANDFEPFYLLNIYAPAQYQPRRQFYNTLTSLLSHSVDPDILENMLIVGDFNYSYERNDSSYGKAPETWKDFLADHFYQHDAA